MNNLLKGKFWQWILLLFLATIWGSSFILMKRGLESFNNIQVASLRMFIAFIAMLPFIVKHLPLLKTNKFLPILATGLFGNAIPAFLFTKAQTVLSSSFTGMLNSLTPLFTLMLGVFIFHTKPKWLNVLGILIGLTGAIGLILVEQQSIQIGSFGFSFYVIGATVCYAISVNIIKKYLHDVNSLAITALAFFLIGPLMLVPLIQTGTLAVFKTHPEASWINLGYIAILAVVGTAMAVWLFNALIKHTSAIFAASVTYLIPIIAIFWGVLDGETLVWQHFLFIAIILGGVYLVNLKPKTVKRLQ